jgi:hypothetical protein
MNDSTRLDDLDAAWDRLVQSGAPGEHLDAASTNALNRLHRLQAAADAPLSGHSRRWIAPRRSKRHARFFAPRFNIAHAYAIVAALLLVSMTGAFSMSRGIGYSLASATPIPALGGPKMYRVDQATGAWQAMNPLTLADLPGDSTPGFVSTATPQADVGASAIGLVSADGSTVVRLIYHAPVVGNLALNAPMAYEVYDAKSMALRSRIDSVMQAYPRAISSDGARLSVFEAEGSGDDWYITGIKVYDTQTGSVISSLNLLSGTSAVLEFPVVDSTATHAYVLSRSVPSAGERARDVRVTEYELATGKPVHELTIPNLLQNSGQPLMGSPSGTQVIYHGLPGIGLSPDDQTLAVLSPSSLQVTLIDTADWSQTSSPRIETSGNSPCFPSSVDFYSGLTFVGNRLVASGFVYSSTQPVGFIDFQRSTTCSIELPDSFQNVQVVRGKSRSIDGVLPVGWYFRWTTFLTDGANLYVVGIRESSPGSSTYSEYGIFRLNPATLEVEAQAIYPIANPSQAFNIGFLLAFAPPS